MYNKILIINKMYYIYLPLKALDLFKALRIGRLIISVATVLLRSSAFYYQ